MSENDFQVSRGIAIEEHAWNPGLREALLKFGGDDTSTTFSNNETTNRRLLDVGEERLARMDAMGVDFQVLSIPLLASRNSVTDWAIPGQFSTCFRRS
jgi:hypothetical protein